MKVRLAFMEIQRFYDELGLRDIGPTTRHALDSPCQD